MVRDSHKIVFGPDEKDQFGVPAELSIPDATDIALQFQVSAGVDTHQSAVFQMCGTEAQIAQVSMMEFLMVQRSAEKRAFAEDIYSAIAGARSE